MSKTKSTIGALVIAATIAVAVFILMKSTDLGSNSGSSSVPRANTSPTPAGPALTMQPVMKTREEGVIPLPSDAVGTSQATAVADQQQTKNR